MLFNSPQKLFSFSRYLNLFLDFLVLYENVVEELFPDTLLKNQNWSYIWISSLKFCTVCFYCMPNWGLSKYIETKVKLSCRPISFTWYKALEKNKKGSGTSLPTSFFSYYILIVFSYYKRAFKMKQGKPLPLSLHDLTTGILLK